MSWKNACHKIEFAWFFHFLDSLYEFAHGIWFWKLLHCPFVFLWSSELLLKALQIVKHKTEGRLHTDPSDGYIELKFCFRLFEVIRRMWQKTWVDNYYLDGVKPLLNIEKSTYRIYIDLGLIGGPKNMSLTLFFKTFWGNNFFGQCCPYVAAAPWVSNWRSKMRTRKT